MRFCFTTLIFNFVANSRASIGDCHFGPEWLFVGPTEEEERKSILQCSERGNEVHAPRQMKIARDVVSGMLHLASKKVQDPITNSEKYLLSRGLFDFYLASLS